ncbi:undecaprenyl-diphosphate phosphatase, partial [Staphylococcus aureus]
MVPAGMLGLLVDDFIEEHLLSVPTVMIGLFVGAIYMIIADKYSAKVKNSQTVDQSSYFQAFVIGISQVVAMWSGFSR